MHANNGASSSSSVCILPSTTSYAYPAHHTMNFNTKPAPAPAVRTPAPFYGAASPHTYNAYATYDAYAYGAQYPHYAAARLGASGAPSNECYLRQQRTIEIIALEEVPAPLPTARPRRRRPQQQQQQQHLRPTQLMQSVPASSSAASSSTCTSSSGDDDDDEDEEGGESYCSSEEDTDPRLLDPRERAHVEVSFNARMRRIEQWRETYAKAVGAQLGPFPFLSINSCEQMLTVRTAPSPSRTNSKRKGGSGSGDDTDADMDNVRTHSAPAPVPLKLTPRTQRSRTSKRSRNSSHGSHASSSTAVSSQTAVSSTSARSAHSCSACDACFPDASSLKRHGAAPATNEACRAAVEYGFEGAGAAPAEA